MSITPFLFLDPSEAVCFVERWRPQIAAGQIMSGTGVDSYARTRIALRDPECIGMLANVRNAAYVLHGTSQAYEIASCLWPHGTPSLQEFRDLREWCDCMIPSASVRATLLRSETERELWTRLDA